MGQRIWPDEAVRGLVEAQRGEAGGFDPEDWYPEDEADDEDAYYEDVYGEVDCD